MRLVELAHDNNAYRVHYSKRDESFDNEFGTHKDHSWVPMFLELWCEVSNEWLNINLDKVDEKFLIKVIQRIEDANA